MAHCSGCTPSVLALALLRQQGSRAAALCTATAPGIPGDTHGQRHANTTCWLCGRLQPCQPAISQPTSSPKRCCVQTCHRRVTAAGSLLCAHTHLAASHDTSSLHPTSTHTSTSKPPVSTQSFAPQSEAFVTIVMNPTKGCPSSHGLLLSTRKLYSASGLQTKEGLHCRGVRLQGCSSQMGKQQSVLLSTGGSAWRQACKEGLAEEGPVPPQCQCPSNGSLLFASPPSVFHTSEQPPAITPSA